MRLRLVIFSLSILVLASSYSFAEAATGSLSGWAWSDTIGWISFNNVTDSSPKSYGVNVNSATGNLSGFAWNNIIGWISFNEKDTEDCPIAPCRATLSTTTRAMNGWARAITAKGRTDGWDGWISLRGKTQNGENRYGVALGTTNVLEGYAWGDTTVGWIAFHPVGGGVSLVEATGAASVRRISGTLNAASGTTAMLDGIPENANPALFKNVIAGEHEFYVSQDSRAVSAASCTYPIGGAECTVTNPALFDLTLTCNLPGPGGMYCKIEAMVAADRVTKLIFKYSNSSGDFLVKRIMMTDSETPDVPEGSIATLDGVRPLASNPAIYENVGDTHVIGSSNLVNYTVSVGSCSYKIPAQGTKNVSDVGPSGCTVTSFSKPTLVNGVPTYKASARSGYVQKIVFKYTPNKNILSCQPEDPARSGVKLNSGLVGQPIRWTVVGKTNPDAVYMWKDATNNTPIISGAGITTFTKVYTTAGLKKVDLYINNVLAAECSLPVSTSFGKTE